MYNLSGDFQPEGKSVIGNEALTCSDPRPPEHAEGDFALRRKMHLGGQKI